MEYLQLKTLVDSYNIYFTIYNFDKKHATHLNPTIVLKSIYQVTKMLTLYDNFKRRFQEGQPT
jgi:hypothetical protein